MMGQLFCSWTSQYTSVSKALLPSNEAVTILGLDFTAD